jgi:hypothetical protein
MDGNKPLVCAALDFSPEFEGIIGNKWLFSDMFSLCCLSAMFSFQASSRSRGHCAVKTKTRENLKKIQNLSSLFLCFLFVCSFEKILQAFLPLWN